MPEKEIIRHDSSDAYLKITHEAENMYPNNVLMQLGYIEHNGTPQQYALALVSAAQKACVPHREITKLKIPASDMDFILRALTDSMRHMQEDLPDGVYDYIISKMTKPLKNILKQTLLG